MWVQVTLGSWCGRGRYLLILRQITSSSTSGGSPYIFEFFIKIPFFSPLLVPHAVGLGKSKNYLSSPGLALLDYRGRVSKASYECCDFV